MFLLRSKVPMADAGTDDEIIGKVDVYCRFAHEQPAHLGLSFGPSAALREGLHATSMRAFPRLADEPKSCAICTGCSWTNPYARSRRDGWRFRPGCCRSPGDHPRCSAPDVATALSDRTERTRGPSKGPLWEQFLHPGAECLQDRRRLRLPGLATFIGRFSPDPFFDAVQFADPCHAPRGSGALAILAGGFCGIGEHSSAFRQQNPYLLLKPFHTWIADSQVRWSRPFVPHQTGSVRRSATGPFRAGQRALQVGLCSMFPWMLTGNHATRPGHRWGRPPGMSAHDPVPEPQPTGGTAAKSLPIAASETPCHPANASNGRVA